MFKYVGIIFKGGSDKLQTTRRYYVYESLHNFKGLH